MSEGGILQHVLDHTTPRAELGDPVDSYTERLESLSRKFSYPITLLAEQSISSRDTHEILNSPLNLKFFRCFIIHNV